MKRFKSAKNKPLWAVVMVAIAAAVSFWLYNWYNAKRAAGGKSPLGAMAFSIAILAVGGVSLFVKRLKVLSAPLLMVGGVLIGLEAVRNVGPMNGWANRYRRGQARPAFVSSGMDRPVATNDGLNRPVSTTSTGFGMSGASSMPRARSGTHAW